MKARIVTTATFFLALYLFGPPMLAQETHASDGYLALKLAVEITGVEVWGNPQ